MVTCTTPPFRAAVRLNSGVRHLCKFQGTCCDQSGTHRTYSYVLHNAGHYAARLRFATIQHCTSSEWIRCSFGRRSLAQWKSEEWKTGQLRVRLGRLRQPDATGHSTVLSVPSCWDLSFCFGFSRTKGRCLTIRSSRDRFAARLHGDVYHSAVPRSGPA